MSTLYEAVKAQKRYRLKQLIQKGKGRYTSEKVGNIVKDLKANVGIQEIMKRHKCGRDLVYEVRDLMP